MISSHRCIASFLSFVLLHDVLNHPFTSIPSVSSSSLSSKVCVLAMTYPAVHHEKNWNFQRRHHQRRNLQVTVRMDWSSKRLTFDNDNNDSNDSNVAIGATASNETMSSTRTTTKTTENQTLYQESITDEITPTYFMDTSSSSSTMTQQEETNSTITKKNSTVWIGVGLFVAIGVIMIGGLVLFRNHERNRWHEYRTIQLLQAQDEAFDLSFVAADEDDDFDMELSSIH